MRHTVQPSLPEAPPPAERPAGRRSDTLRGIALMSVAMLLIPLVDGLAKHLSTAHSPLFISWARYAVAALLVLPVAFAMHGGRALPRRNLGLHALRTALLVGAMTLYFVAIAHIPLATAISAYFVGPVVAALLGIVFLREHISVRKAVALILGFAGALLVLEPGGEIEPGVFLALGSGVLFALYLVTTRLASRQDNPLRTLALQCLLGTVFLAPLAVTTWSPPDMVDLPLFAALGIISALSHVLSITAFRYAETSTLAPLVYLELVGTSIIGFTVFGELPGLTMWIGSGVIVAAGLLLLSVKRTGH